MNFKPVILLSLLVLSGQIMRAQTENNPVTEPILESVSESAGEDFDFSELTERLNFYRNHPLDINRAGKEQLQELMFLSPLQIHQIMEYRKENGYFIEFYELQCVQALDPETIRKLLPFITLRETSPLADLSFNNLLYQGKHDLLLSCGQTLERQAGYSVKDETKTGFAGSPQRLLARYRYHYGNQLSASLTMEKDAGEAFFSSASVKGFDFYSGNVFYRAGGLIRKIAIGDYALQFGQGLTLWSGLSFGKGASVAGLVKNESGLKPYSSANEALFLRGLASTIHLRNLDLTPFVSYRKHDATLEDGDEGGESMAIRLNQSGLHRTSAELKNKNSLRQWVYGLNAQYSLKSLKLGLTASQTQFDKAFEKGGQLYNQSDFASDQLMNMGIYYHYGWRNVYLFGEGAHSLKSGYAFLNGALVSLHSSLSLVLFQRNYQKNYYSFFNQAVSEGSAAVNEKGFYSGLIYTPNRKLELSSYVDFFRFPWIRFQADAPSSGYEIFSQLTYSPSKRLKTIYRYKIENKEENEDAGFALKYLERTTKQNFRLELQYKPDSRFQFRSRAEAMTWRKAGNKAEPGFLLLQDIIYHPLQSKLSGNVRFALFSVRSFNARIYAYENDVLYGFSFPAYQNKGLRFYVNTRYHLRRNADIWLRYAITSYADLDEIGSGPDKISGNQRSDFKVQLRLQF